MWSVADAQAFERQVVGLEGAGAGDDLRAPLRRPLEGSDLFAGDLDGLCGALTEAVLGSCRIGEILGEVNELRGPGGRRGS